ncbi:MAG: hypothetical protein D6754_02435 [Alphaproteobacteria bacterium]|nr:MAG: hypothetical protein D6754_02435 [Alphaproteobacteria bacterium]
MPRFIATLGALALIGSAAVADTPPNGLGALSVSPDGTTILTAGDSRVLFTIDAASLEVTQRYWLGTTPVWLGHTKDGLVLMRDTSGDVSAHDPDSFAEVWRVRNTMDSALAAQANWVVYTLRRGRSAFLEVADASTGEVKASYELGDMRSEAIGVRPDGMRIAILGAGEKRPSEERQRPSSDLKGIERELFRQQHDQRGARIVLIDVQAGSVVDTDSWYSAGGVRELAVRGDDSFVLTIGLGSARIGPDGEPELIDTGARSHYGAMLSSDGTTIVSGSLAEITAKGLEVATARKVKLDRLPGWPEYVVGFAEAPDGGIIATTSGFRVLKLPADLSSVEARPVY